jgi:DNA polymerase I-like protein with 3'-5' exonuclease and polymerase domains
MRSLVRPPPGWGIAYIDWSAQEIGVAAAMSGDGRMIEAYASGDPYMAFAIDAGLAPVGATKQTHSEIRDKCKGVVLGVNYGMGFNSLADRVGITPCEAQELLRLHRQTYKKFWQWSDGMVDSVMLTNQIMTVLGWRRLLGWDPLGRSPNTRSLMNFPMQANGAEMMRIAAIAGTEAGIEVCAPVHDAFLIAAPLERLDDDVRHMRELMTRAGSAVTAGLDIRTDAEVFRWPGRYVDSEGKGTWDRIMDVLARLDGWNSRKTR